MKIRFLLPMLLCAASAFAATERGTMIRAAQIYLSPDANSPKLAVINRGHEVAVLERTQNWVHVLAVTREQSDFDPGQQVTGWMLNKGYVLPTTPNGDRILFGEAVDSENEASRRGGRKGAAGDARRLYARTEEYFPTSPLAGEALYRAADIQWQIDREDVFTRPSARQRDPNARPTIDDQAMKHIMHKYAHTKWADMAAFHLIDNKLCGDWQGLSKCPEKEAELYEKYASEYPQSPDTPEALYQAARRQAALIDLYPNEQKQAKVPEAKSKAQGLCQRIISQFGQSDWAARAQTLLFEVDQGVPVYGNALQ